MTAGVGPPPKGMAKPAVQKWRESAVQWSDILTPADRDALRLYCEAWAEMLNAQKRVDEDGAMILTPNGMVQKSPWLTKLEHSRDFCRRMLADMIGTASARGKPMAAGKKEQRQAAAEEQGQTGSKYAPPAPPGLMN